MGSKQSGSQTVKEKSDPWIGAQPYLSGTYGNFGGGGKFGSGVGGLMDKKDPHVGILPEAERLYANNMEKLFNADELAAMDAMRARGGRDYGLVNTGLDTLQKTARGDYLGQQNFMDAYGEGILNEVNSRFAQANRTGSGYAAQAAAKGLTQGAAPLYAQERALQQQAAMAAPSYQAGQYGLLDADIEALMQVGRMRRNRPYENLENYANIVLPASGMGGTSASDTPLYSNPMAGAMGGAIAGGQMYGGYGALIGGALGYLSSR